MDDTTRALPAAGPAPTGWAADARHDPWRLPNPAGPGGAAPDPRPAGAAHRPGRRRTAVLAAIALTSAVVGGAAGAGTYAVLDDDPVAAVSSPSGAAPATGTQSGPGTQQGSTGGPVLASVEEVAAAVLPSVVSIGVATPSGSGTGSGIIITSDGTILTNNHVVESAVGGGSIQVTFQDGSTAAAEIVGRDPLTDLAVVQARDVDGLTPARLGSSAALAVGEQVVAVGSPLGLEGTVTTGIVSALRRPVVTGDRRTGSTTVIDAVQTDAPINPGNSGGPLVNMAGEVVGINSAIATSGTSNGSIGLGFAIPIDQASPIADELVETGTATHARLGVSVGRSPDGARGAYIAGVDGDGAAQAAGLRDGDLVTKIDDRLITSGDDLVAAVRSYRPGETVTLTLSRHGQQDTVQVTLGSDESTARS